MSEIIFTEGMRVWKKNPKAPDFIKCDLTVNKDEFIKWLNNHADEKGEVKLQICESKKGTLYAKLNTYVRDLPKPEPRDAGMTVDTGKSLEDIPF